MVLTQPVLSFCGDFTLGDVQKSISKVCIPSAPSQSCPDVLQHPPKLKVILALKELLDLFSLDQIFIFIKQMNSLQLS